MFDFLKKGKEIEIQCDKSNYSQGETIKGKVILKLKNPAKARSLRLDFWGEQKTTRMGSKGRENTTIHVFDFKKDLDGSKEYSNQEYNFEIKIPNIAQMDSNQRLVSDAASSIVSTVFSGKLNLGVSQSQIKWFLKISIDIPMRMDVSNKIQLNIV